ncbi:MAG TPA: ester cyclase [Thermomicrobiales bacterium]|nr:ester cyclase [Thermomicrobiales bacterium]
MVTGTGEANAAIFRRIIEEGFNRGDLAAMDALVAPDMVEHQTGLQPGLAGLKETIGGLRRDFPDFSLTIEDLVADGDKVWARMRGGGIHRAGFFGQPYTGEPVAIDVIDICRFAGGKMVEHWGVPDRFNLLEQLGLLPGPQPATAGDRA